MVFLSFDVVWMNDADARKKQKKEKRKKKKKKRKPLYPKKKRTHWISKSGIDTRKIIFVDPRREKITILNPEAKPKNRVLVSRNFEYMKNLIIPIANSHLRREIEDERRREEKRKRRRKVDRERVSNRDSCCIVQ